MEGIVIVVEILDIWLETAKIKYLLNKEEGWNMRTVVAQAI